MIKLANNLINLVLKQAAGPSGKQYVDPSWHPPQLDRMPNIIEPPPPGPVPTHWPELPKTTVTPLAAITRGYKGNVDVTQRSIASARQNQALHPELIDKHTPHYTEENLNRQTPVARFWGIRNPDGSVGMAGTNASSRKTPTAGSNLAPPFIDNGGFTQTGYLATAPIYGDNEIREGVPVYDSASEKSYLMPNAEIKPEMVAATEYTPQDVNDALANMHPSVIGHHEVTHNLANNRLARLNEPIGVTADQLDKGIPRRVGSGRRLSQFNAMQLPNEFYRNNSLDPGLERRPAKEPAPAPIPEPEPQHLSRTNEFPAGIAETKSRLYQDYSLDPVYDTPAKMDTYMENLSKLKDQYPDRYGQMYNYLQSLSPEARMATVGMIAQNTATKGPYGQQPVKMQA